MPRRCSSAAATAASSRPTIAAAGARPAVVEQQHDRRPDARIGLGLIRLKSRPHVVAHIDVGAEAPLNLINWTRNANVRITLQATQKDKFNFFWDEGITCQDPCDGSVAPWTARDVVRHLHSDGTVINNVVSAIMTPVVRTCTVDDDLDEVMQAMTEGRFRHIPVVDGDQVVGIVSIGDMVKHKIDQLPFERDQLDRYVHQS